MGCQCVHGFFDFLNLGHSFLAITYTTLRKTNPPIAVLIGGGLIGFLKWVWETMFAIDTTFGALWFVFRVDGLIPFIRCLFSMSLVRLLNYEGRLRVFNTTSVCRDSAVEWVTEDSREMVWVLNSLVVSGVILLGRRKGTIQAQKDFIAIVRKAAFRRANEGKDATELYAILDDLKHHHP